jgi:hypothetical protein|tara:strand:+ start:630 stop:995 length:366 start_codon:yes stop_codon:yes gene_type:complete
MATKSFNLGQIGDFAENETEELVEFGATRLLQRLQNPDEEIPVDTGTMFKQWFKRPVSSLEIDLINKLEYAEPVTFGTNLPPSWKNGYQLTKSDNETPIPKDWVNRLIEKTKRDIIREAGR